MKLGDIVIYEADEKYMGVVLEVKHNVCKVIWLDHELIGDNIVKLSNLLGD